MCRQWFRFATLNTATREANRFAATLNAAKQHLRQQLPVQHQRLMQQSTVPVEYRPGDFAVRSGYAYRPTPLPEQRHDTNLADTDAHLLTLGAAWAMPDPEDPARQPLVIGLSFQATLLRPRRHEKVEPADPTGTFKMDGAILSVGLDLTHDF